jgi:hypothetical protein
MRRSTRSFGIALLILTAPGFCFPRSGAAQQAPKDQVPFKATAVAPLTQIGGVLLPSDPPLGVTTVAGAGQSELLGSFTYTQFHITQYGVDAIPKAVTQAHETMTAANGDAIFLQWSGLVRPDAKGFTGESSFAITGGRGRFQGAVGSGQLNILVDVADKKQVTYTWEGTISRPK